MKASRSVALVAAILSVSAAAPVIAQVAYAPYARTAPTPYGYPVPYGYLQPNEELGTSPSFEVLPYAYGAAPAVHVMRRCQYPHGWNAGDFTRDVNGIPNGVEHTCPLPDAAVRARY